MTSARRLRKSERFTKPTVWVERRSSAVFRWEVNRGFGVEVPEGGLDVIVLIIVVGIGEVKGSII